MEKITANCPKCSTQYQLTEQQLSVADGQVRCGSCMTVFRARPAGPASAPQAVKSEPQQHIEPEEQLYSDEERSLKHSVEDDLSDSFKTISGGGDNFGSLMDSTEEIDSINTGEVQMDEDWAEQLLNDEDEGEEVLRNDEAAVNHQKPLGSDYDDFDDLGLDEDLQLIKPELPDTDELPGFSDVSNPFADEKEGLLQRITPEPLEFHVVGRGALWAKVAYSLVACLAIVTLMGQFFYFQFDEMARQKSWRPFYAIACEQLACELPSIYDLDEISAKHLTVKSHDYYKGILVVDTVITNHASINQPFPQLELFFTDNNQQVIAARRFMPSEYLRGELAERTKMPSRQPVHLALEIDDPGSAASGYWVRLTYPDKS